MIVLAALLRSSSPQRKQGIALVPLLALRARKDRLDAAAPLFLASGLRES